jgi:hypothetical protein
MTVRFVKLVEPGSGKDVTYFTVETDLTFTQFNTLAQRAIYKWLSVGAEDLIAYIQAELDKKQLGKITYPVDAWEIIY